MKKNIRQTTLLGLLVVLLWIITSCDKKNDSPALPVITDFELGLDNSQVAHVGSGLHIEAQVVAEETIETIEVKVHPEGEEKSTTLIWEIDSVYTQFSGLKNTLFHEHIEIPAEADTGYYHVHFTVTDQVGYQSYVESELLILPIEDLTNASMGEGYVKNPIH